MKALCDLKEAFYKLGFELKVMPLEQACCESETTIIFDAIPLKVPPKCQGATWKLFLWEPPTVVAHTYCKNSHQSFDQVFTLFDDLTDGNKYRKFQYPQPKLSMIDDIVPFAQKKLCTLIACNKKSNHSAELYSHRLEAIYYFEENASQDFDFYGLGWQSSSFLTYKGLVDHKVPYLKQYKFSICYENMCNASGYITEKIFDSFVAGCVPVYWGAENVSRYIPENCYIARERFASHDDLYNFLKNMPEATYNEYLENIRNFFSSDAALVFSIEYFIDLVVASVIPNYDRTVIFSAVQIEQIARSQKYFMAQHH